jgi:hypothetical protein
MQTVQSSVFCLYSSLLTAGSSNTYGTANTNFTDVTFSNINIRQILGSNYGKYRKFNLSLTSLSVPTIPVTILSGNESLIMFYMSGLNFSSGSAYSSVTGLDVASAFIGDVRINQPGASLNVANLVTYPTTFFNTFSISKDITDITINLRSVVATLTATGASFLINLANAGAVCPKFTYTFFITPILETALLPFPSQEEQTLVYKQRLIKS